MATSNQRDRLLETARDDFPHFYANATAREKKRMDILVLLTALVLRLKQTPEVSATLSRMVEETCNAAERTFLEIRGELRASATVAALPMVERKSLERVIFGRVP